MAGPPDDKTGSELVRTLHEPSPSEPFVFRRKQQDGTIMEMPIRVRTLRTAERTAIMPLAQAYAREHKELQGYSDLYRERQAIELLARVVLRPEPHEIKDSNGIGTGRFRYLPYFATADQCAESLSTSEMAQLLNLHEIVEAKYGNLESLTEHEVEMWVSRLADGYQTAAFFLSQLDSTELPGLLMAVGEFSAELCRRHGLTLPDWRDSLESNPSTSNSAITSSSGVRNGPSGEVETPSGDAVELPPPGQLLDKQAAIEASNKIFRKAKKPKT